MLVVAAQSATGQSETPPESFEGDCMLCVINKSLDDPYFAKFINRYGLNLTSKNGDVFYTNKNNSLRIYAKDQKVWFISINPKKFKWNLPYGVEYRNSKTALNLRLGGSEDESEWTKKQKQITWKQADGKLTIMAVYKKSGSKMREFIFSLDKKVLWNKCNIGDENAHRNTSPPELTKTSESELFIPSPDVELPGKSVPINPKPISSAPKSERFNKDFPETFAKCIKAIENKDAKIKEHPDGDKWDLTHIKPAGALKAYYEEPVLFGITLHTMKFTMDEFEIDSTKSNAYFEDLYNAIQNTLGDLYKPEFKIKTGKDKYGDSYSEKWVELKVADKNAFRERYGPAANSGTSVIITTEYEYSIYDDGFYYAIYIDVFAHYE